MASSGANLAVTKDGDTYNKLQRPDDYLISTTPRLPPLAAAVPSTTHSSKRKRGQDAALGSKRARADRDFAYSTGSQDRSRGLGQARECGMRTILPGLDEEEQLLDDSMGEAIAYLRSVRSEASSIPTLLVAPTSDKIDDEDDIYPLSDHTLGSARVVYKEGIWIAVEGYEDGHDEDDWDKDHYSLDSQESCYMQLLKRFQALRKKLVDANIEGSDQNVASASEHPDRTGQPRSKRAWLQILDREYPTFDRVSCMDEQALYLALQSCTLALGQSTTISREKSSWIWTLLALAGDIGTLDHERISRIRDLGLQARRLSDRLRRDDEDAGRGDTEARERKFIDTGSQQRNREDVDNDVKSKHLDEATYMEQKLETGETAHHLPELGHVDSGGSDAEMSMSGNEDQGDADTGTKNLEQARARLLAQLGDRLVQPGVPSPERASRSCQPSAVEPETALTDSDWNTRVTIDMILTVAAECYGQKDLLESRAAW